MSGIWDLVVRVIDIRGKCPVYQLGDSFRITRGFQLGAGKPICMHSLASIMPYYTALSRGTSPVDLGLSKDEDAAYLQCLDPCDYTNGVTIIFSITREVSEP